ncbi:glycosyltransferase family 2 protein [Chitinibacteraceae bacterium HSL-7]
MYEVLNWLISLPMAITCLVTLVFLVVYVINTPNEVSGVSWPSISILLPYYNEDHGVLLKTLEMLDRQEYPSSLQVVLIDDGSTNGSSDVVRSWLSGEHNHRYVLVSRSKNGGRKGEALDEALMSGILEGDVYIVVDSDTWISQGGVREIVRKLWSDSRYAAVCGFISPENYKGSLIGRLQYFEHIGFYGALRAAQDALGCVPVLAGAFVAHRAAVVKEIGGWSDWLVEDISWCWKALASRYRTGYAPKAHATTQCPETSAKLFRQRRRWARGRVEAWVTAWRVSWWSGMVFTPWFIVSAFQFLLPPVLLLLPVLIYYQVWTPLYLSAVILTMYMVFTILYLHREKTGEISFFEIIQIPIFALMMELWVWLPNVLGYADEVFNRKKDWLTR